MEFFILLVFVFVPAAIAIYGGLILDEKIWSAKYPVQKTRKLAGWAWVGMSAIPFATGALILIFVWAPLPRPDFLSKVVTFIFGGMHLVLGIVFVVAGIHYFLKR
jgi:hypothetical protein